VQRRSRRSVLAFLATALAVVAGLLAGRAPAGPNAQITVYAAASLTDAFPKIDPAQRYQFAGSNTLAAQIAQGAPADVFAAANMTLPGRLHAEGLCARPVVFARNALVIVVPRANPAGIHGIHDLTRSGVKIVVAGAGVPVGDYTLRILKNLNLSAAVQRNVVSRERDVRDVLAKVALGEADAGFVYATDAKTVSGRVSVLRVPARAQPEIRYGICIVARSGNRAGAQAFIDRVLGRAGQARLLAFGFLPRVKPATEKR
jgi:molybdate transport system substrate-binding protein